MPRALYLNVLDRPGAPEGLAFWTRWLEATQNGRADLLLAFAGSAENTGASALIETLAEVAPGQWDFV